MHDSVPSESSRRPAPLTLAALALALAVAIVFSLLAETMPAISDPAGYIYAGQRLAAGEGLSHEDPYNNIAGPYFVPYAFQVSRPGDSRHYLGFPPGFPLLLAVGERLGAIHAVVPLLAGLTILATYALGKALTGRTLTGFLAAILLAATPAVWHFGTAAWSEIPATLAVTGGVVLYLHSRRLERDGLAFSLLAAAVLSFGHFIRYTNVAFLAALAAHELYVARRGLLTERWRRPFWIAAAIGVLAIPLFNHFYYGGALITSYSPIHGWYPLPPFALAYALGPSFVNGYSLRESVRTLWQNFPLLLLLVPAGWWLMPADERALLGAAVAAGLLPYTIYAFAPSGINSRFLLPILPFLAVAIGHLLATGVDRLRHPVIRLAIGLAVAIGLLFLMVGYRDSLVERNAASHSTVALAGELVAGTEPEAVILSYTYNDLVTLYHDRSVLNYRRIPTSDKERGTYRMEMLEPCLVGAVDRLLAHSIPVYYIEDQQPSYWDSLDILRRHFRLGEPAHQPPIYRVIERNDNTRFDESPCRFSN